MPSYDLSQEYGLTSADDQINVSPSWLLAVVRFAQPLTFSRSKVFTGQQRVSFNDDTSIIAQSRPLLLIRDCIHLAVTSSKDNYVSSLNAVMIAGDVNYLAEILPNDWIFAWMVNNEEKIAELENKLWAQEPCNLFDDGLKFMGRVQSVRKNLNQSPDGIRTVRYQLQALGGKEFDSSIFYDPHLGEQEVSIGQYLARFNIGISDLFNTAAADAAGGKGGIDSNKAIPTILKLLLGDGVPPRLASPGGLQIATGLTATKEAPYAYAVPNAVGRIIGKVQATKESGTLSYADLFELMIGIQKYGNASILPGVFQPEGLVNTASIPESIRAPNLTGTNRRITPIPLKGTFLPKPVPLVNRPVWSIINEFLNPAINEMYYTLRVNPEGFVVPTLVVRQLPFSSETAKAFKGADVTAFLELPRWSIPTIAIRDLDIGRSDAAHFNFVHVYGQAAADQGSQNLTQQIVRNPPIRDEQDIKRSGVRPYMQTVACSIDETFKGPRQWMEIIADFLIGQQYTLNGTLNMQGVQSPICPGDNLEVDAVVYHIEAVIHTCTITPMGTKTFLTSLALTHGVRSDSAVARSEVPANRQVQGQIQPMQDIISDIANLDFSKFKIQESPLIFGVESKEITVTGDRSLNPDFFMYSGITPSDNTSLDPGKTVEILGRDA
jgi:hypothetical protein